MHKSIVKTLAPATMLMLASIAYGADAEEGGAAAVGEPLMESAAELARRADDRRPDEQSQVYILGRPLTIGGEYELNPEVRRNFNLTNTGDEDLERVDQELDVEFYYPVNRRITAYAELRFAHRTDSSDARGTETDFFIRRGQAWILFRPQQFEGLSLQVGRQNIKEKRAWWWDTDVDAIRVHWDRGNHHAEVGIAEDVFRVRLDQPLDVEDESIRRMFGRWQWEWTKKNRMEFFWLNQNDRSGLYAKDTVLSQVAEDEIDGDLRWLGVRAIGRYKYRPAGRFHYWLDIASVSGKESVTDFDPFDDVLITADETEDISIDGWAFDFGVTWETKFSKELNFTFGYAVGSGPGQGLLQDKSFRQTGINTNAVRFRGVDRFRYYGELLRPELSNLAVFTVGAGRRLLENSSIDLIYHQYWQIDPVTTMRGGRLDLAPNGISADIGEELDLVLGFEEWQHWEVRIIFSLFRPGAAFSTAGVGNALRGDVQIKYIF